MEKHPNWQRRHSYWLIAAFAVLMAFVACTTDDVAVETRRVEIAVDVDGMATRTAGKTAFSEGDAIAVCMDGYQKTYTLNANGSFASDDPLYWIDNEAHTVTAFYPVEAQTEDDVANQTDYMKAETKGVKFPSKVKLTFKHLMSKAVCNLVSDGAIANSLLATATVELYVPQSVSYASGEITAVNTDEWQWVKMDDERELLVPPTTIASGTTFIRVTIGDITFTYDTDQDITFTPNKANTFNITLTATGISVTLTESGQWSEGTSENVALFDKVVTPSEITSDIEIGANQTALIVGDGTEITNQITVNNGATVTLRNVTSSCTSSPIKIKGNATIKVEGENTLTVSSNDAGITVPAGSTLTLDGTGSLTIKPDDITSSHGAGIGCAERSSCGDIVIKGGTYDVQGGEWAAGIGGGLLSSCGAITIDGGTIIAKGGPSGSGIGSGNNGTDYGSGRCGKITINGGTITAIGGGYTTGNHDSGAGIGAGDYYALCEGIEINGGTITAIGSGWSPGIGSGSRGSYCGYVTINGGTVTAMAGTKSDGSRIVPAIGAGIFNEIDTRVGSTCGKVTIKEGVTSLTLYPGINSTYIGAVNAVDGQTNTCDEITIADGAKSKIYDSDGTVIGNSLVINQDDNDNYTATVTSSSGE